MARCIYPARGGAIIVASGLYVLRHEQVHATAEHPGCAVKPVRGRNLCVEWCELKLDLRTSARLATGSKLCSNALPSGQGPKPASTSMWPASGRRTNSLFHARA